MSVSKIQESTQKKGCQVAVWVVMVLSALGVAGAGFFGCFSPLVSGGQDAAAGIAIVHVDDEPVTLGELRRGVENFTRQFGGSSSPEFDYQITSMVLGGLIDSQLIANLASSHGITISEEEIIARKSDEIDDEIRRFRLQAIQMADLKETATEAEFQKYFEERTGKTTADYKDQLLSEVRQQLEDETILQGQRDLYASQALEESLFRSMQATDDEIKNSYTYYMLLPIVLDDQEKSIAERESLARQAVAELDAGVDFAAVQKKYMKNPITDPQRYNLATDILASEVMKPVADLKPGGHSQPITEFGTVRVFKLAEVKSEVPEDFEDNKQVYGESVRRQKAREELTKQLDAAKKSARFEWHSAGYKAIYELQQLNLGDTQPAEKKTALLKMVEDPADTSKDPAGDHPGVLARFAAMRQLEGLVTADERTELRPVFIEVMENTLMLYEDPQLRLDLVDLYKDAGNKAMAGQQLLNAARNNTGFSDVNVQTMADINTKLLELEGADMVEPETATEIRDAIANWNKDKQDFDEYQRKAQEELDMYNTDRDEPPGGTTTGTTGTTGQGN